MSPDHFHVQFPPIPSFFFFFFFFLALLASWRFNRSPICLNPRGRLGRCGTASSG